MVILSKEQEEQIYACFTEADVYHEVAIGHLNNNEEEIQEALLDAIEAVAFMFNL